MNKKGSLELSITAIVVIVIAFVVLGLGLTLTKTIFKGGIERIPGALDLTQLEAEPTSQNPITISDRVEIGRGKTKAEKIGYYNTMSDNHLKAILTITDCTRTNIEAKQVLSDPTKRPSITSVAQDVGPSQAAAYKIILTENGLLGGNDYICTIAACPEGTTDYNACWEKKQFFLYVTS
ncbi:hypothetical protein HYT52_00750 [Candidatus Woesearchaeota archaeon]|nr:hypothetical protein [Candidatus Woesearchaeota archaeon]